MSFLYIVPGFAVGFVAAYGYFRALWRVTQVAVERRAPKVLIASFAARAVVLVATLAWVFHWSVVAGLSACVGFLVGRALVLRPFKEARCN